MDPRTKELALLDRCVQAACGSVDVPRDKVEADVFRYAAMLLATARPDAARSLWAVHQAHYSQHPGTPASFVSLQAEGLLAGPGRFQEMLMQRLREHEHHAGTAVPH